MIDKERLYSLDYLRGINAIAIMLWHYTWWTFGPMSVETVMGRLSAVRVPLFYVLSGLTLYHVYYDKMQPSWREVFSFWLKRVLRLYPLLILVTCLAAFFYYYIVDGTVLNWNDFILNITGLFGFVKWDAYFSAGVWSVGNELVFCAFFPLFLLSKKCNRLILCIIGMGILSIFLYFTFFLLPVSGAEWRDWVNPLNQLFLFFGGYVIGMLLKNKKIFSNNLRGYIGALLLLCMGFSVVLYYPLGENTFEDAFAIFRTGSNRVVFTLVCFLICAVVYKMTLRFPNIIHAPLVWLGKISYSVFLLHPIIYLAIINQTQPPYVIISIGIVITLLASHISREYFEQYFIKLGNYKLKK